MEPRKSRERDPLKIPSCQESFGLRSRKVRGVLSYERMEEIVGYIGALEKPSGGFAYARTIPSGIEDTYFALQTLDALGIKRSYHATRKWLIREPWIPDPTGRVLYYRLKLYKRLGLNIPWDLVRREIEGYLPWIKGNPRKLDFMGRIVALAKEGGKRWEGIEAFLEKEAWKVPMRISLGETLESLWRKMRVSLIHGRGIDRRAIREFVDACRNPDGGYGCKPHTTSFLEHIYYALVLYLMVGVPPPAIDKTASFIKGCQSKRGGFGRSPGGVPFIHTTFYATRALEFVGKLITVSHLPGQELSPNSLSSR